MTAVLAYLPVAKPVMCGVVLAASYGPGGCHPLFQVVAALPQMDLCRVRSIHLGHLEGWSDLESFLS